MANKHIVFDFDGVLADSFDVFMESLLEVQPKYFTKRSREVLVNISKNIGINNLGVKSDKFESFTQDLRDCYLARTSKIKLFPNVKETIETLTNNGNSVGIVSSNSKELVNNILEKNNITSHFEFIVGDIGLNGKDNALTSLAHNGVALEESWYIGDTPHDIKSAKHANMLSAASCWGYTSKELMEREYPDVCIHSPTDIIKLKNIS